MKKFIYKSFQNHLMKFLDPIIVEDFMSKHIKIHELEIDLIYEVIYRSGVPIGIQPLSRNYKIVGLVDDKLTKSVILRYVGNKSLVNAPKDIKMYESEIIQISLSEWRSEQLKSIGI